MYRSEPQLKTLDPKWPSFSMSIQRLCSGDWDRVIKFTVWDWNKLVEYNYEIVVSQRLESMASNVVKYD